MLDVELPQEQRAPKAYELPADAVCQARRLTGQYTSQQNHAF